MLTCQASRLANHDAVKRMILPSMILPFRMGPLRRRAQVGRIIEGRIIIRSGLLRCHHGLGCSKTVRLVAVI